MITVKADKNLFKFKYLPDYAAYLLENMLEDFVLVGIRFSRELDLPMLKPLAKIPENELVKLSLESNKNILKALVEGTVATQIEDNLKRWVSNKLEVIDKLEISAEDLTLAYHIRRKLYSHFLYGYTKSAPVQQLIINEVDVYTSMEELISLKVYLSLHSDNLVA